MKATVALTALISLVGCQKATTNPTTTLLGDWYQQQVTFYDYDSTGKLIQQQTTPAGTNNKIIITDSTVIRFSDISGGPGPTMPGKWVASPYFLRGDTIYYDHVKNARPTLIKALTPQTLTLRISNKAYPTAAGYLEYDEYYIR